jgi:hypothetical protein
MAGLARADAPLTRDYQALIAEYRRAAGGEREPPAVAALRAEQRAWIDARDRRCRVRSPGGRGRSGVRPGRRASPPCRTGGPPSCAPGRRASHATA